jgi:Putative adhesin
MSHFETHNPISVVLELRAADVRVTAEERQDTSVQIRPSNASRPEDVTAAELTRVEYADGRLLVKAPRRLREWSPFSDGGSIDVDIELPAGSQLLGHAAAGGFRCTGALGRCELKSGAGEISVDRVAAATLVTAGNITLDRATGDAQLSSATGEVRAGEIDGSAVIKNSNGDTRIRQINGDVRVKAANGDIDVGRCGGSVNAKTANGDIRVGGVRRGSVVAETATGQIEIAIAGGAAAWLDLDTHFGRVHNALEATQRPQVGDDAVEVRARTGFGDITIRRDAALDEEPISEMSAS